MPVALKPITKGEKIVPAKGVAAEGGVLSDTHVTICQRIKTVTIHAESTYLLILAQTGFPMLKNTGKVSDVDGVFLTNGLSH